MKAELYLLMLMPFWREKSGYEFISSNKENITIPSADLTNKLSIEDVLDGIVSFYFGSDNFKNTFILNDVELVNNSVNIYYYIFVPPNTKNINGYFKDLEQIKFTKPYNKIISKLIY
jgi:hypothetical protein